MDNPEVQPESPSPEGPPPAQVEVAEEAPKHVRKPATQAKPIEPSKAPGQVLWATGRRKEAVARVRLIPGTGTILVNHQPYDRYFPREMLRLAVRQPLLLTHQLGKVDVLVNVEGGGLTGQAGAVRLGIARALTELDPALRGTLRGAGLLTRDPRMKERKKYGRKGARKRFQWTKR